VALKQATGNGQLAAATGKLKRLRGFGLGSMLHPRGRHESRRKLARGDTACYLQRRKGNPIGIVYPQDGVPPVVSPSAITSAAPNPNAARLFSDFIFTKEVQQFRADSEALYVPHPEVSDPAGKPKLTDC
jgi:hypothetical protein